MLFRPRWLLAACVFFVCLAPCLGEAALDQKLDSAVSFAGSQLIAIANDPIITATAFPCYAEPGQDWFPQPQSDWVAGFFPGSFWLEAKITGDPIYAAYGATWSPRVPANAGIAYDAYKTQYDFNASAAARTAVINATTPEINNFITIPNKQGVNDGTLGLITATPWRPDNKYFSTTNYAATYVDFLLNIREGLWVAAQTSNAAMYHDYIVSARTAYSLLTRPNGGSHHWVYVRRTAGGGSGAPVGAVFTTQYQGYDDTTTWARGQSWMIHGMTDVALAAKQAGDTAVSNEFIGYAEASANFWLSSPTLQSDGIPPWDFNTPATNMYGKAVPKNPDASAAAITASGLIDLSQLAPVQADKDGYLAAAEKILASLSTSVDLGGYLNQHTDGSAAGNGVLVHSNYCDSYSKAAGNNGQISNKVTDDASVIWGDYYYLEAVEKYLLLTAMPHGGDANNDGKVDVVDLGVLAKNYDQTFTGQGDKKLFALGDFNGDKSVDVVDLGILAKNYDWTGASNPNVPEPLTLTLLVAGITSSLFGRRRCR